MAKEKERQEKRERRQEIRAVAIKVMCLVITGDRQHGNSWGDRQTTLCTTANGKWMSVK